MGGLGNQLFQLAFGLDASKGQDLALVPLMQNVRKTKIGTPDLADLVLPDRVRIGDPEKFDHPALTKLLGLGLRSSSSNSNTLLVSVLENVLPILSGEPVFSFRYSKGLGSDVKMRHRPNSFYIGYFQSHRFASNPEVFEELMKLSPSHRSQKLEETISRINIGAPYMVHIRLTDYLKENSFGVPSEDYYRESLTSFFDSTGEREVWVFSDDMEKALEFLPSEFSNHYIPAPVFEATALNWELMRHFDGYVIGNSSFSWWSAFLRFKRGAPVFHPWPWFKNGNQSRSDLIPEGWTTVIQNFHQIY